MSARVLANPKLLATSAPPVRRNLLQRKCACGNHTLARDECEECSKKRQSNTPAQGTGHDFGRMAVGLQPKLTINQPGDRFEREADRMANAVVGESAPIHREEPRKKTQESLQRGEADSEQVLSAPRIVEEVLQSPGEPLDRRTRVFMESCFGHDFGHVRIHTDTRAAESAQRVSALAYTVGNNIVFGDGRFSPDTQTGRWLIAHELTHLVQQSGADETRLGISGSKNTGFYSEADLGSCSRRTVVPLTQVALARKELHDDEETGTARFNFYKHNDHLSQNQLFTIAGAVMKATYVAKTYEVAHRFFDYYSGWWFGSKIRIMTNEEEAKAKKKDRFAETDAGGDTRIRPDILGFESGRLGAILLHELSHTGQTSDVAGFGSTQEGQSYGIEYFYAERLGDTDRMDKITKAISTGSVTMPSFKSTLQDLFKVAYTVMTALRELHTRGSSSKLPTLDPPLTSDDGEVLLAEYVTNFANQGDRLQKIVQHIGKNLAIYYTGPGL